jgi:signal transduction histidine kinase
LEKAVAGVGAAKEELFTNADYIAITLTPPDSQHNWLIAANAGALVTVFFNVLVNAVQQIELHTSVRRRGTVKASMQFYKDAERLPWALAFISDSGPGIHPDDWDRIFDAGFTTKEEGTGLGLHICRLLLSRIKDGRRQATIRIVNTVLWAGTTVGIRLPLSTETRKGE